MFDVRGFVEPVGSVYGCVGDLGGWPAILERIYALADHIQSSNSIRDRAHAARVFANVGAQRNAIERPNNRDGDLILEGTRGGSVVVGEVISAGLKRNSGM